MAIHDNYVALMARLCTKHGRDVTVRRDDGATPVDPARPWLGSVPAFTDVPHRVVFLDNDMRDLLILLPGRPDERTAVSREIDRHVLIPRRLPDGADLPFDVDVAPVVLIDGAKTWQVTNVIKFQPGPTLIGWRARVSV